MRAVHFFLGVLVTVYHVSNSLGNCILGGSPANILQHPYIVAIVDSATRTQYCSATIISSRDILTAAHCVLYSSNNYLHPGSIAVVAGVDDLASGAGAVVYNIQAIIAHPSYLTTDLDYDVALLHTATTITFSAKIQPIPFASTAPAVPSIATVAVWGRTGGGIRKTKLHDATVPTIANAVCAIMYSADITITDRMICASNVAGGSAACQCDSGGPMVFYAGNGGACMLGVDSFGMECGQGGYPGVYAYVYNPQIYNFIVTNTLGIIFGC